LQTALDTLERNQKVGADTTEAQKQVQDLVNEIDKLDPDGAITKDINLGTDKAKAALKEISNADVNVDASISETSVTNLKESINGITPEMTIKAGIDKTIVNEYDPDSENDKTATVTYKIDTSKVDEYKPKDLKGTVWYTVKAKGTTKVKIVSQEAEVNGTAHSNGTAFAHGSSGTWGIKDNGISIGGELGEELLVFKMPLYIVICNEILFNCWNALKQFKLQHNDEISVSVKVTKVEKIELMVQG
jgi:hypothetical protein